MKDIGSMLLTPPDWYWPYIQVDIDLEDYPEVKNFIFREGDNIKEKLDRGIWGDDNRQRAFSAYCQRYMLQRQAKWIVDLKNAIDRIVCSKQNCIKETI